jgi:hypothetical protein
MVPVHECIGPFRNARNTLNARRCGWWEEREEAARGYHPHCSKCYVSIKDRSLSPHRRGLRFSVGTF